MNRTYDIIKCGYFYPRFLGLTQGAEYASKDLGIR